MADDSSMQRIVRLTPLAAIVELIETRVKPVEPQWVDPLGLIGRTLAQDISAQRRPARDIALRDGYAVEAAALIGAGPYTPLPFAAIPLRVDTGEPMPEGCDAVLPLEAVNVHDGRAEAIAPVLPGEGLLAAGADADTQTPLRRAGSFGRAIQVAALKAAGIEAVAIREPRISLALGGNAGGAAINAALGMLVAAISDVGAKVTDSPITLENVLAEQDAAAVIAVGGTGSGRRDDAVEILARLGRVEAHGIAMSPGETAAFGFVGERAVLIAPGRLDAALAVWLLIGRHLLARLAGAAVDDSSKLLPLKRKVTSTIGMSELVAVRCADGMVEPLASGYLSFTALTRSDGWIVIPPDSEGFAAGTEVAVRSWP